jgi:hypothetical protein
MNFPVFSQLAGNFGFSEGPLFIDSKNSETSSHLTLPSSGESANHRFLSGGAKSAGNERQDPVSGDRRARRVHPCRDRTMDIIAMPSPSL